MGIAAKSNALNAAARPPTHSLTSAQSNTTLASENVMGTKRAAHSFSPNRANIPVSMSESRGGWCV